MYIHGRLDPNDRFRERRRQARRRRRLRRAAVAAVLLALAAGLAVGASFFTRGGHSSSATGVKPASRRTAFRPLPREVRGVHVTMALASIQGKLGEYLALRAYGLNTVELDVKDENGQIGFDSPAVPSLARRVGAARPFYDPVEAARAVHAAGVYLIGRVVVFEDPTLTAARPDLAIKRTDGAVWTNNAGLGWANPYDARVWKYVVGVAAAAARAGFDEIQFDYVRFPSDGDLQAIVYPHRRAEPKGRTIERFFAYARRRLRPLGVRISADLFGLAATHDLGIGQAPRRIGRYLDAVYPMVYPSHYAPGEYNLTEPEAFPGRTVARSLLDYRRRLRGRNVRIIPWLQDFSLRRSYGLVELTDQVDAARAQHAAGFMLWNPEGIYTEEALTGR